MRRAVIGSFVVAAAVIILAAPGYAFDQVFQQTYPLPAGGNFQLQNVNGSVSVAGWDREEVEVHAVKTAKSDPRDLERVKIEVQSKSNSVTVQTRYPQDDGVEVYVEYKIRVPRRVQLGLVATVNGNIKVSDVDGTGELRSVNGNIEAYESAGRLSAHTTNGNVHLELRRLDANGTLVIDTVNGSVVLALPPESGAELDVRSLNGDFRSELPVTMESSLGSREYHGQLGPGGGPVRLRTVNGGIRVVALRTTV